MLKSQYPYYLANTPIAANTDLEVKDKYSGTTATRVALADNKAIEQALDAGKSAESAMRKMPSYARKAVLRHCVKRLTERAEDLAYALCVEAGKPIKDAQGEVTRLIDTFDIAAEEATRMVGEVMPLDISERTRQYRGMWKRVPIGLCSFISPFNFPLNLVAHKVAPAIAVGNPFILKPASMTPIGALIIGEILAETDLPKGAFSILPCHREAADLFTVDDRINLLSFTGSPDVGWALKNKAGKKPVILELGGNAACILDEDTDLDDAIKRVIFGTFYQSGQSCISVQRIFVHEKIYSAFVEKMVIATKALKTGDPKDPNTFVGPLISESAAIKLEKWINEAKKAGATLLTGGTREGAMITPTLLVNVPTDQPISCEEAFGPVAVISKFSNFKEAIEMTNQSRYGLQVGIFTRDIYKIQHAWDEIKVGGVIIGDVPSWRVDNMPYGGSKDSGLGREGIRFSMQEMTEIRLLAIRDPGL
jgi:acyl-CoA reductase-like NAD-dependent aldehyde dehydrogenase